MNEWMVWYNGKPLEQIRQLILIISRKNTEGKTPTVNDGDREIEPRQLNHFFNTLLLDLNSRKAFEEILMKIMIFSTWGGSSIFSLKIYFVIFMQATRQETKDRWTQPLRTTTNCKLISNFELDSIRSWIFLLWMNLNWKEESKIFKWEQRENERISYSWGKMVCV